jgi:thiosulfate reductase cytochrome b subunit
LRELYVILGRLGWAWLGVWLVLVAVGLLVQHYRRRRRVSPQRNGVRGFEVTVSDEKQS